MKKLLIALSVLALLAAWLLYQLTTELRKGASEDPTVWEQDIIKLEETTQGPAGSTLFTGSSSIRLWSTLAEDMAPIPVIQRGFGGAKMEDVRYYAQRLVAAQSPEAIVIFVGTNDITPGNTKDPQTLLLKYQEIIDVIRKEHADTPIYYIAITPSPSRWEVWDIAVQTNELILQYTADEPGLHFIDTSSALLNNGVPNPDLYLFDGLHLNQQGYAQWTRIIRDRLVNAAP